MTLMTWKLLGHQGIKVLSRGYGGKHLKKSTEPKLVRAEEGPRFYGDEPYVFYKNGIDVVVGPQRLTSAQWALNYLKDTTGLLLDDGFQHRKIQRDLDIVLIDVSTSAIDHWLFPLGLARETKSALKRAHVLVFTRCDLIAFEELKNWVESYSIDFPHLKIFKCNQKLLQPRNLNETFKSNKSCEYNLISGVAKPFQFEKMANQFFKEKSLKFNKHYIFKDHFDFSKINSLNSEEIYFCTEKDFYKIIEQYPKLNLFFFPLEFEFQNNFEKEAYTQLLKDFF